MPHTHHRLRPVQISERDIFGHSFRVAHWPALKANSSRGFPLLFFTGIGANLELLAPFLESLTSREVITLDMPGTGGTKALPAPYRLSAMVRVADKLLSEMGHGVADVMGVSWGGMLAQEFAYRCPRRLRRLVLAATTPGFPMVPGNPLTLLKMLGSHRYDDPASIATYLHTLYGGRRQSLETYPQRMRTPHPTGYTHQILAIAGWTSLRKLTRVRAPTLILMGDDDRLVPPANGEVLKFLLRCARLEVLTEAGHLFLLTHARETADLVDAFLDAQPPLPVAPDSECENFIETVPARPA